MASVVAIRDGIAANLDTVDGLTPIKRTPSELSVPAAAVIRFDGAPNLRQAMNAPGGGLVELLFTVEVFVPDNGDSGDAEERLDEFMAGGQVWTAIESDRTLGGAADDCVVTELGPYELVRSDGSNARFIMGSLALRVLAGG